MIIIFSTLSLDADSTYGDDLFSISLLVKTPFLHGEKHSYQNSPGHRFWRKGSLRASKSPIESHSTEASGVGTRSQVGPMS